MTLTEQLCYPRSRILGVIMPNVVSKCVNKRASCSGSWKLACPKLFYHARYSESCSEICWICLVSRNCRLHVYFRLVQNSSGDPVGLRQTNCAILDYKLRLFSTLKYSCGNASFVYSWSVMAHLACLRPTASLELHWANRK